MSLTLIVVGLASAFIATMRPARAQPATAQAEVLFREGKRLMTEGNITAACDAFEGSYKIDSSPSTLMNLADCREKNQQYASAWAHFVETARLSAKDPTLAGLATKARERAAAVEPKLSYLIINVPDEARLDGLTITRNGIPVDPVQWNRDIPIDGGDHQIEGKAPAYEAWSTTVHIENAKDKQSVNVPRFREALAGSTLQSSPSGSDDDRRSSLTGKRKLAVALWAVGAVGIGGGIALEIKSGSTYDDAKADTDNARRHELTDDANRQRRLGFAADAIGIAAIGVGAYLWFTGGRADHDSVSVTPTVGDGHAGLVVVGAF